MNELALFAGAGGGILGGKLLGWRTVCAVEWEPYPASVLCARQNDGLLPPFPIWDDVQTFDGKPWRGIVDVVSGGFPCQDISAAGTGGGLLEAEVQCGSTWRELLAKYNPDTLSWKTAQCSLLEDLEQSLETWPRWGSMRNGECFRQPMLAQTISGKEFGSLQEIWPTPRSCSAMAATITPKSAWNEKRNPNLETIVGQRMWPTPVCQDSRHAISRHLDPQNKYWKSNLGEVVMSMETENTGRLNPMWVEWLMGWPLEWTDLKPLGMGKSPCAWQQPSNSFKQELTA